MPLLQNFRDKNPFIVVGVGRSGTSTTARVLRDSCNVFMGDRFRGDHYEDLDFKNNDDLLLDKKINLYDWRSCLIKLIRKRQNDKVLWGFKNPRNAYLLDLYFEYFYSPRIIYCIRNKKQIIDSLMRNYGWSIDIANTVYNDRTQLIEDRIIRESKIKNNVLLFDFTTHLSDEYIVYKIKKFFSV